MKKKIAIFTGNRAEYGLQYPILKAVSRHKDLDYQLIVSGAHLDHNFGKTINEINSDGFKVSTEVNIKMDAKNLISNVRAIGNGILSISKALEKLKPDIFVVYADRFEGFAAVISSTQMNIPTAHVEGGDITEGGALDDSVRHSMSKLSHLHFTTNEEAKKRLLLMGEESWRVHNVGFPAIDLISEKNFASKDEVKSILKLDITKPIILFTQHSVTTQHEKSVNQLIPSLNALKSLASRGLQVIITYPNNDAGGSMIIQELEKLKLQDIKNINVTVSLGRWLYHGILNLNLNGGNVVCVGNSSSGIKETPAFLCPAVNIGSRQDGRLRAENVIDVDYKAKKIISAVEKCLYDKDFKSNFSKLKNPYGEGNAGIKIAEILSKTKINDKLITKRMTILNDKAK